MHTTPLQAIRPQEWGLFLSRPKSYTTNIGPGLYLVFGANGCSHSMTGSLPLSVSAAVEFVEQRSSDECGGASDEAGFRCAQFSSLAW